MRIGSLFSGAGGLDMAVQHVFGGPVVWHSELDAAASKVLAHRYPGVPNLGDITAVEWEHVEPVDVLCGGYPCQPFSAAGQRKGTDDARHLWPNFAEAIRRIRPRYVVLENVAGHRSMGFDSVLADLADIGYDAQWCSVRASDVGAPHRRERLFVIANPRDRVVAERARQAGREAREWAPVGAVVGGDSSDAADSSGERRPRSDEPQPFMVGDGQESAHAGASRGTVELLPTPAACNPNDGETPETWLARRDAVKERVRNGNGMGMPLSIAVQLLPTPRTSDTNGAGQHGSGGMDLRTTVSLLCTPSASDGAGGKTSRSGGRIDEPLLGGQAREMSIAWGKYEPAIRRWENLTRPAPAPTEPNKNGNPRLSAAFSEWLMGWPSGHVTTVPGLSRNDQLRIIGNGVVPQQAIAALSWLLSVSEVAA